MLNLVQPVSIQCPYCWEMFEVLVDCSVEYQEYVEDCEVCCRPILLEARVVDDVPELEVRRENG